jgi:hypothetical protein
VCLLWVQVFGVPCCVLVKQTYSATLPRVKFRGYTSGRQSRKTGCTNGEQPLQEGEQRVYRGGKNALFGQ